jgi:ribosomal protein S3
LNGYRLAGDLQARVNWRRIMEKVVEKAIKGDVQAIKFCEEIARRQDTQFNEFSSGFSCLTAL